MDKQYSKSRRDQYPQEERERVKQWRLKNPEKYAEQVKRSVQKQREKRQSV